MAVVKLIPMYVLCMFLHTYVEQHFVIGSIRYSHLRIGSVLFYFLFRDIRQKNSFYQVLISLKFRPE